MKAPLTTPFTENWFASGERIKLGSHNVFVRTDGDARHAITFMPGYPDGSIGWAHVLPHLPDAATMPYLTFDYLGMGDSDKPRDYEYSTAERADLVEALWSRYGVESTTLVAFDFSSLVVLEHLARRLEYRATGPEIRGIMIFNGGLFTDGHTHPWHTTPLLRISPAPPRTPPFFIFKFLARVMWSKSYAGWEKDARDILSALDRNNGYFFLSRAAGFDVDHRAQGTRLDFGRLYRAFPDIPFLIGGSDEDPFEHRQVDFTEQRLGLTVARLPGGHLTTHEQPKALAQLIERFYEHVTTDRSNRTRTLV